MAVSNYLPYIPPYYLLWFSTIQVAPKKKGYVWGFLEWVSEEDKIIDEHMYDKKAIE